MKKLFHHSFGEWMTAIRPWSFPASVMPVAVTLLYLHWQGEPVRWAYGLWALVNLMSFHAAGNTWSDYFDYRHGVDAPDTFGTKTLTSGMFSPREMMRLSLGLTAVSLLGGVALLWMTGWPLLLVGLTGVVCSLLYPPLKYRALGDLVIFIDFALLPTLGTAYVATLQWHWDVLFLALPVGLITVAILHANNTRDISTDSRVRVVTFAMLLGGKVARQVYRAEILIPFPWLLLCVCLGVFPGWSLLACLALVPAWGNVKIAGRYHAGAEGIATLDQRTARLQMAFSLLLALSFLLGGWLR